VGCIRAAAAWAGSSSIVLHFEQGPDETFTWPAGGLHPDARVQRLAAMMQKVLEQP
jgi:hypothetical protein